MALPLRDAVSAVVQGHSKLTDFGTSKDEDAGFSDDRQDAFVGTAEYVSPEVLRDEPAHAPADLWALGVVAYQLLTGRCSLGSITREPGGECH